MSSLATLESILSQPKQLLLWVEILVSDNKVADTYVEGTTATDDILEVGAVIEAINAHSGPGEHITVTGTGNNIVGVGVTDDGNLSSVVRGTIDAGGLDITPYDPNAVYTVDDYVRDTDGVLHRFISTTVTNGLLINTAIWETIGGANQIGPATQSIGTAAEGSIPANTSGARVSLGANNQLLNVPNGAFDVYGIGGIDVTVEENRVIVDGSGIEGGGDIDILDLETVFSFTDSTLGQDLVGYVTSTLHGTANVARQSNGSYDISNHTLTTGDYYIFTWASSYAIGLATSATVFATVETHLATGDALPTLNQEVEIVNLVNVHRQELPVENSLDIISNSQAISLINQEIGVTYDEVDEDEVALRIALGSSTNAQGEQSNPANIDGEDPEYLFGAGHVLIWYVTLTANDEATTADQRSALELAVHNRREFAVTPSGTITDVNVNDSTVYHFTLTTLHDFGDDAAGNETFQVRAVLVDPTRNDAFRTAFGFVGPDPLHYPDRYHFATQNVIFDHIQVLESRIVTNVGIDTALRAQPATVATDAAWTSYINSLDISAGIPQSATFLDTTGVAGSQFILTDATAHPDYDSEADIVYVGLYTLVQDTNGTKEWIHADEYLTTGVDLNYPSGHDLGVRFYGNKGIQDVAQDVIDTAARVYNEMNTALALKSDVATAVVDTDVVLNSSNEVTGITIGTGDSAVTRNLATGGLSDAFRYSLLLTNGFLMQENTAMSTDDRDAYTDTLGAYGNANAVYWFDNTDDGWYNVSTGGTALISFL